MSIAGRTTLTSITLNNALVYHMSIYLLPKTTVNNQVTRLFSILELGKGKEGALCKEGGREGAGEAEDIEDAYSFGRGVLGEIKPRSKSR